MDPLQQQQQQYLLNNNTNSNAAIEDVENGDARSKLFKPKKGFLMPAVSRDNVNHLRLDLQEKGAVDGEAALESDHHFVNDHDHDQGDY